MKTREVDRGKGQVDGQSRRQRRALLFQRAFSSTEGKQVLEILMEETIFAPANPDISEGALREKTGRDNLVREILKRVNEASNDSGNRD